MTTENDTRDKIFAAYAEHERDTRDEMERLELARRREEFQAEADNQSFDLEEDDVRISDSLAHKDTPRWPLPRSDPRYRAAVIAACKRKWSEIARSRQRTRHHMGAGQALDYRRCVRLREETEG